MGKKKFPHISLSECSRCFESHQTRSALRQTVGWRGWLLLSSPGLLPGMASASAILAFPCICSIPMQIFGTGSWFCSLAHPWGREPCGWLHRPFVTYQLASDHELLQAAFPADSNTFWHAFLCLESTNRELPLHSPSSIRSSTQSEVIPPERRNSSAEFAVMAERGTRWSAAVTKGMNLNPLRKNHVKPELGISRSAPGRGPTGLHLTEGLFLRPLKSSLCLQELQIKPKRRHHFCRQ